ncbi:FecR family protein [Mucilaginibacter sp. AW1-7]|uniref:FecR family protein n=1 Tax=Mucilaginibacter sp. AW1-7 TaxID=3349874 RepID=UPI003F73D1B8
MEEKDIKNLLDKYRAGTASEEEIALLESWYLHFTEQEPEVLTEEERLHTFNEVWANLQVKPVRRLWPRIAAAASILLMLSAGGYFLLHKKLQPQQVAQVKNDLKPGMNGAILTLANGQKVVLEKTKTGAIATGVQKTNDSLLTYNSTDAIGYNTLETPKGRQYAVVLPDGSKVWLNAASSLKYPTKFTTERLVELTGEAYFEVVHNSKMPFKVRTNNQITEDIGTAFNINSYGDEPNITTTLVEGAITVNKKLLKPGQAAIMAKNGTIRIEKSDVEKSLAWKNGLFNFENMPLPEAMRQLSRWYDVEVEYPDGEPKTVFHGEMHRNVNASQVLDVLKFFKVNFEIEQGTNGKKIIVKP